jgi:hypothetical protein
VSSLILVVPLPADNQRSPFVAGNEVVTSFELLSAAQLAIERAMIRLPLLLGIALFAAGPMILGYQAIGWLVHGYWIGMPLSAFWSWLGGPYPGARLDGDELLYWLFRQPLSAVSVVTGAAVMLMSRNRV